MEVTLDGCEYCIPQWRDLGGGVCLVVRWICNSWEGVPCVQSEEGLVWPKAGTTCMYGRIDGFIVRLGFTKSVVDSNLY